LQENRIEKGGIRYPTEKIEKVTVKREGARKREIGATL
jgi:hypothetical protein